MKMKYYVDMLKEEIENEETHLSSISRNIASQKHANDALRKQIQCKLQIRAVQINNINTSDEKTELSSQTLIGETTCIELNLFKAGSSSTADFGDALSVGATSINEISLQGRKPFQSTVDLSVVHPLLRMIPDFEEDAAELSHAPLSFETTLVQPPYFTLPICSFPFTSATTISEHSEEEGDM